MQAPQPIFWFLCAGVVLLNGAIFRARAQKLGSEQPDLLPGYLAIARGFVTWLVPLFLLIALGVVLGWSTAFAMPPSGQPHPVRVFDVLCYSIFVLLIVRGTVWIFPQRGAEFLAAHWRLFQSFPSTPWGVRLLWTIAACVTTFAWTMQTFGMVFPKR